MTDLLGGRYRRERALGAGAMGEVWLAEDVLLGRRVAIKNVAITGSMSGLATPVQQDLLARIRREARLAARMNHPSAVCVYDLVVVDDRPYVVMEYVDGISLADEIAARGALQPTRVAEVGAAVADALGEAHGLGIVHRDVKPANILIGPRGRPKLADFGIARIAGDGALTTTGVLLGTPAFIAPEVARGAPADAASDVWSLGITLYTALEGRSPFQEKGDEGIIVVLGRVLNGALRPPANTGPVMDVVLRLLHRDPRARPDAAAAAALLRAAATRPAPPLAPPTALPAAPPTELRFEPPPANRNDVYQERTVLRPDLPVAPPGCGHRSPTPFLVGVGALLLVAAVALVTILTVGHGSSTPRAAAPHTSATAAAAATVTVAAATHDAAAPGVVRVTTTETQQLTAPSVPSATSSPANDTGLQAYSYVGAANTVSVQGPAGFYIEPDTVEITATSHWHDFVHADADDRWHQPYLHIGVGNPHPVGPIATEAAGTIKGLKNNKHFYDVVVQPATYTTFCGVPAADVEFTEARFGYDIPRHGKLRIWESNGETLILELDSPAAEWAQWGPYFDSMVSGCAE